jgi:hypothetical protein
MLHGGFHGLKVGARVLCPNPQFMDAQERRQDQKPELIVQFSEQYCHE